MKSQSKKILAMYDIRGIQNYIFRTSKIKDAIGASAIVEHVIEDSLYEAAKAEQCSQNYLSWYDKCGALEFKMEDADVQVLYIGGGNAYVLFSNKDLCLRINKQMSRYVIEHTYSLQLAIACVYVTESYADDYRKVQQEMVKVKANMTNAKPLGALPVAVTDAKTGYAIADIQTGDSTESLLKKEKNKEVRKEMKTEEKILDNYVLTKGLDSWLAVVHIDGNNMGLRIRNLIEGKTDYEEAVNEMRRISYNMNHSYQLVFDNMKTAFETDAAGYENFQGKQNNHFIMKVLVAGDDITYVCNAKIALATVEYYCKEISKYSMNGQQDPESLKQYGFSVCAGVAFIHSHYPFHAGYEAAEACCGQAKERAKEKWHTETVSFGKMASMQKIGNWVDFQVCNNIQAKDLNRIRQKEFLTCSGESLLRRPYWIATGNDPDVEIAPEYKYGNFKEAVRYFQNKENLPRSFAKNLRNLYPQGEAQAGLFLDFLESRGWKLPDDGELYEQGVAINSADNEKIPMAKWYDALEMMDYCLVFDPPMDQTIQINGGIESENTDAKLLYAQKAAQK